MAALVAILGNFSRSDELPRPTDVAICQLTLHGAQYDGTLIRVEARVDIGMEFIRLYGASCPHADIFVGDAAVDVTGCADEAITKKYGCPLNPGTGVLVILTGRFRLSSRDSGSRHGLIDVAAVRFVSSEHRKHGHGT
jgi:hypothetical protein